MMKFDWERFYTPFGVAKSIIDSIPTDGSPDIIADICAGSGNLLHAAQKRWPNSLLLGLDIDPKAISSLDGRISNLFSALYDSTDISDIYTSFEISKFLNRCDIILANPPFGYLKEERFDFYPPSGCNKFTHLKSLIDEARRLKRIEAFLLISNILFLKPGGVLASIIPENFFSAEKWSKYRSLFLDYFFDSIYIGEPLKFFLKSEVRTRIYIGKLKSRLSISNISKIDQKSFRKCEKFAIIRGAFVPKSKNGLNSVDNNDFVPVFHSTFVKFLKEDVLIEPDRTIYRKSKSFRPFSILQKNDLLIIRVGRNCGESAIVKDLYIGWHVSDCVYIVRDFQITKQKLLLLTKKIIALKKGLTAQYITKDDVIKVLKEVM